MPRKSGLFRRWFGRRITSHDGFALLSITLIIGLVLAYMAVMVDSQTTLNRAMRQLEQDLSAEQLAEAGMHHAFHCIRADYGVSCDNVGELYLGETNTAFGDGNFTTTVTGSGDTRTVTAVGTSAIGRSFTVRAEISLAPNVTATPGFDHAIQAGDLGVVIENNAEVDGAPIYSDADVECGNNAEINYPIFVTRPGGEIYNCDDLPEAHADVIRKSDIDGDAYYRSAADFIQSSASGHQYPDSPTPTELPLPSFDLDAWHALALKGGTVIGDYQPADGTTLGPVHVRGDLHLEENVAVTVTGPIWVEGDVELDQNSSLTLHAAYGAASSVLLADTPDNRLTGGYVSVENNVELNGSGTDGSYLLVVSANSSTDDDEPAIAIANNAAGAIFYAPFGGVRLQNNARAVATVGRRVYIDQRAEIDYDNHDRTPSDMVNATSAVGSWLMRPGSWREIK